MRMLIPVLLLLTVIPTLVMAQQKILREEVGISSFSIAMPLGRMLLIGRDNFMGAVKFLNNQEKPDGSIDSKYECFEYEKGGFRKVKEGEVSLRKPSTGFWAKLKGFLSFHENPLKMAGAPLELRNFSLFAEAWKEHSTVYFWDAAAKPDVKVRLAPTPWKEIGEVNLSDPRIRWFAYDQERNRKVVPIDEIWD